MNTKDLAMKNYPRCWTDEMVQKLVAKGKLTSADYEEITGNAYPEAGEVSAEEALAEIQEVLA
ncbi:MAG: XkdX family protein [Clostridia bacterium]|nr:XkdX family protein [Oscillospiraceae bacterium]MBQ9733381.1 XkdX family protein [Clostridia bacterium]